MTIARSDAATYLAGRFAALATAVGVANTDDAAGWGDAISDALLALGTAYADLTTATVDTADGASYRALLRYHGLRRLAEAATIKFSVTLPGGLSAQREGVFRSINALLTQAEAEVRRLGLLEGAAVAAYRVGLDFLEPALAEW